MSQVESVFGVDCICEVINYAHDSKYNGELCKIIEEYDDYFVDILDRNLCIFILYH